MPSRKARAPAFFVIHDVKSDQRHAISAVAGRPIVIAPVTQGSPKAGPGRVLVRGAYYGRYVPSGHLLYIQQGTLFAVPMTLRIWQASRRAPADFSSSNFSTTSSAAAPIDLSEFEA